MHAPLHSDTTGQVGTGREQAALIWLAAHVDEFGLPDREAGRLRARLDEATAGLAEGRTSPALLRVALLSIRSLLGRRHGAVDGHAAAAEVERLIRDLPG